ncbi:PHD and RING finger domain-containing protein 1 [Nymphaea thermarum]|nr:PHD and RING finger domain-containing protein 1 [Nymphaea thermarum]
MSRGKNSLKGGRKRRRGESSDDSDEDFVVDDEEEEEDEEDEDYDEDDCEDCDDAGDDGEEEDRDFSGSEDSDDSGARTQKIKRNKPGRKLSGGRIKKARRRGRVSCDEEEEDEDFYPGSENSTGDEEEEEELVVARNSVKRKVAGVRRRKGRRTTGSVKKVRKSAVDRTRKRRSRRVASSEEEEEEEEEYEYDDDFEVEEENTSRKRTRSSPKAKKKRSSQRKMAETPSDLDSLSDADFVLSDEETDIPREVPDVILATRSRRSPGLKGDQVMGDSGPREQNGRIVKFVVEADRIGCKGKEKLTDFCKQVCGICLSEERKGTVRGKLNCCDHFFCFICIMEWSKVESRCPMCKQRFETIDKLSNSGICLRNVTINVPCRNQVYQPSEEELRSYLDPYANIVCMECHQGGDDNLMLLCDICDSSAHTYCVGLGMVVPEGNWYCEGCKASDPESSNLRALRSSVQEQFVDCISYPENAIHIDVPSPFGPSSQCLWTSVSQPSCHINDAAPRFPVCGDSATTSPTLGAGASTVMGRRRLRRQIHSMLTSNRMSEMPNFIEVSNRLLNRNYNSNAIRPEEQDLGVKEQLGRSKCDRSDGYLFHESGRYASSTVIDSFGESSSQHLQHINYLSPSVSGLRTTVQCPNSSTSNNLSDENISTCEPKVAHPRAVWYEEMQDLEEQPRIVLNDDVDSSQVHDAKEQVCALVKPHLKALVKEGYIGMYFSVKLVSWVRQNPCLIMSAEVNLSYWNLNLLQLEERGDFKDIAKRSTHTILAAYGIKCSRSQAISVQPPNCDHARDGFSLGILINECCSKCFNEFVRNVVGRIAKDVAKTHIVFEILEEFFKLNPSAV